MDLGIKRTIWNQKTVGLNLSCVNYQLCGLEKVTLLGASVPSSLQ